MFYMLFVVETFIVIDRLTHKNNTCRVTKIGCSIYRPSMFSVLFQLKVLISQSMNISK